MEGKIIQDIIADNYFKTKLNEIIRKYGNNENFNTDNEFLAFENGDLFFSLHNSCISVLGNKQDNIMSKQTKNKILIILFYLISLFLFEFIIGDCNFEKNAQECVSNRDSVFALFAPYAKAGFYHFIFISCIAIYVKFSKKIDIEYKHIIYWFPLITFIFSLPMGLLAAMFGNFIKILIIYSNPYLF